ncbi:MAG: hypothetical protein ABID45_03750 [Patescibacteria group bacterium]
MENLIFGIQAISKGMSFTIKSILQYQLFWGFAIGFLVSTLVHGFLISDNYKHIPIILFRNRAHSFQKIHKKQGEKGHAFTASFDTFIKTVNKVRFVFALSFLLFMIIVLLALLRF